MSTFGMLPPKRNLPSPWEQRHAKKFPGKVVPFGALVSFIPDRLKASSMLPFREKTTKGIFVGYHTNTVGKWDGDYEVIPLEKAKDVMSAYDDPLRPGVTPPRTDVVYLGDHWVFPLQQDGYLSKRGVERHGGPNVHPEQSPKQFWRTNQAVLLSWAASPKVTRTARPLTYLRCLLPWPSRLN